MTKMIRFVIKNGTIVFTIVIALLALSIAGMTRIKVDSTFTSYFSTDNALLKEFIQHNEEFSNFDPVVLVIYSSETKITNTENILAIKDLNAQLEKVSWVKSIESIFQYETLRTENEELVTTKILSERKGKINVDALKDTEAAFREDGMAINKLISQDFHFSQIFISTSINEKDNNSLRQLNENLSSLQAAFEQRYPHLKLFITGRLVVKANLVQVMREDLSKLSPFIILFGVISLWVMVRHIGLMLAGSITVIAAVGISVGLTGWLGISLNQTSMMAFLLVFMIAMADTIHISTSYTLFCKNKNTPDPLVSAVLYNVKPVTLTSITTTAGFLGLYFTDSPPFQAMGIIAAVGILIALALSLTLQIALLSLISPEKLEQTPDVNKITESIAHISLAHKKPIFLVCLALSIWASIYISSNSVNNDPFEYFTKDSKIRQAAIFVDQQNTAYHNISMNIVSPSEEGVYDGEFIRATSSLNEWLLQQRETVYTSSLIDLINRIDTITNSSLPPRAVFDLSNNEIIDYLNLYEISAPTPEKLELFINPDFSKLKLDLGLLKMSNKELLDFQTRINSKAQELDLQVTVTGYPIMFAKLGLDVIDNMIIGSLIVVGIVTLLIIIGLQSVSLGLISLIPNLLPALLVFGFWGYFVGELDVAASVTFSISLGIVVDDTIHVLSQYRHYRSRGHSLEETIPKIFSLTGSALTVTTLVLIAGLCVISFSSFVPNQTIGILMAPIVGIALILDLFLLPGILYAHDKSQVYIGIARRRIIDFVS